MSEANFPDGLRAFKPNDNAPDFIKADLEIEKAKLIAWLSGQPDKVRLQIKLSKKGTYYAQVNDYQKANQPTGNVESDLPF